MSTITRGIAKTYRGFASLSGWAQSPFLLFVRLYWGLQFMQTGWGKLHNLDRVAHFFASLGIPMPGPTALLVACVEFFGGALLVLGLASRLAGLVLTVNMVVAFVTADRIALQSIFSDPGRFYGAAPYTFLFATVLILIFGPGWFALDTLIALQYDSAQTSERERSTHSTTHADAA